MEAEPTTKIADVYCPECFCRVFVKNDADTQTCAACHALYTNSEIASGFKLGLTSYPAPLVGNI